MRRILRRPKVEAMTGLGRTRIEELEKAGRFPAKYRISDRAVGWRSDEVEAWIGALPRASEADADMTAQLRATPVEAKRAGAQGRSAALQARREARATG